MKSASVKESWRKRERQRWRQKDKEYKYEIAIGISEHAQAHIYEMYDEEKMNLKKKHIHM